MSCKAIYTTITERMLKLWQISGLKMMVRQVFGFGANPRRPLQTMAEAEGAALFKHKYIEALLKEERSLQS